MCSEAKIEIFVNWFVQSRRACATRKEKVQARCSGGLRFLEHRTAHLLLSRTLFPVNFSQSGKSHTAR